MMEEELVLKVLGVIERKGQIPVRKRFLIKGTGFSELRKLGLIRISKENEQFLALLTDLGMDYLKQRKFTTSTLR